MTDEHPEPRGLGGVLDDAEAWLRRQGIRTVPEATPASCTYCGAGDFDPDCEGGMRYIEEYDAYARCPRALALDRVRRLERRREAAGINRLYSRMRLDTFEPAGRTAYETKRACVEYVEGFEECRAEGRGLLLVGPVGVGKSHLAYAMVNVLVERGEDALAIPASKLLDAARAVYAGDEASRAAAEERLRRISTAEFLLLDDLGRGKMTEFAEARVLDLLTDRRADLLPTLITTNFSPNGDLAARIGKASESRVHEMCEIHELRGDDYRRRSKG